MNQQTPEHKKAEVRKNKIIFIVVLLIIVGLIVLGSAGLIMRRLKGKKAEKEKTETSFLLHEKYFI